MHFTLILFSKAAYSLFWFLLYAMCEIQFSTVNRSLINLNSPNLTPLKLGRKIRRNNTVWEILPFLNFPYLKKEMNNIQRDYFQSLPVFFQPIQLAMFHFPEYIPCFLQISHVNFILNTYHKIGAWEACVDITFIPASIIWKRYIIMLSIETYLEF